MHGQPAIERAAADSERLRAVAHVPIVSRAGLLNPHALGLLERDLLRALPGAGDRTQGEIDRANLLYLREQPCALDDVVELADVPGPRMLEQRLHRVVVERRERLPV